jgi:hypothetical protein
MYEGSLVKMRDAKVSTETDERNVARHLSPNFDLQVTCLTHDTMFHESGVPPLAAGIWKGDWV